MSKPAFTPGPWIAASHPSSVAGWPVVASEGRLVASVHWVHGNVLHQDEYRANARLIGAAPDLYARLKGFVRACNEEHKIPVSGRADEGWIVDTLGHTVGGAYLAARETLEAVLGQCPSRGQACPPPLPC